MIAAIVTLLIQYWSPFLCLLWMEVRRVEGTPLASHEKVRERATLFSPKGGTILPFAQKELLCVFSRTMEVPHGG